MAGNSTVSIFVPSLRGGGAERCMLALAKGLAETGLDVNLVLATAKGPYLDQVPDTIHVADLGARDAWRSLPNLTRYLKRARPSVLLSALDDANVTALIAKRILNRNLRVAVSTHTMLSVAAKSSLHIATRMMPAFVRRFYPGADSIIAVSKAVASDLSDITRIPRRSIHVIHNPVPIGEIIRSSLAPIETDWFDQGDSPVVISVGRLWPVKDHATLIRAMSLVKASRPTRLVILGEGPERGHLNNLVSRLGLDGEVLLPGFVSNPYPWLSRSAVFALPSRVEGLPTVLVEAMACGVSPVATDCPGGSAEVLDGGRYGILTPVGQPRAMADAILGTLDEPHSPLDLRKRAEDFSTERAVQRYREVVVNSAY